jgi:hypothetical protein
MTVGDRWDELLAEAHARLDELSNGAEGRELGDAIVLDVGEHWRGRWHGEGTLPTREGPRSVYLVWNVDGSPGFFFQHSRLVQEVEEARPAIGDDVLVLRGEDVAWVTKEGDERTMFAYSVVVRRSDDPLPGAGAATAAPQPTGGGALDDDVPFQPTL